MFVLIKLKSHCNASKYSIVSQFSLIKSLLGLRIFDIYIFFFKHWHILRVFIFWAIKHRIITSTISIFTVLNKEYHFLKKITVNWLKPIWFPNSETIYVSDFTYSSSCAHFEGFIPHFLFILAFNKCYFSILLFIRAVKTLSYFYD